jgi:hypothetical protein
MLYVCSHAEIGVSSYSYMCPHATTMCVDSCISVLILVLLTCRHATVYVSSYFYASVLILLYMCLYVSSYYSTCVLILYYVTIFFFFSELVSGFFSLSFLQQWVSGEGQSLSRKHRYLFSLSSICV